RIQLPRENPVSLLALAQLRFRPLLFRSIYQHIDAADDSSFGVTQRCGIYGQPQTLAIRPLGNNLRVTYSAALLERQRHRRFFMRHGSAIRPEQLPVDAPFVAAYFRHAAGEPDSGGIEVRQAAFGI